VAKKRITKAETPEADHDSDNHIDREATRSGRGAARARTALTRVLAAGFAAMSLAIVVNATLLQPQRKGPSSGQMEERADNVPQGANTIIIRYDPVVEDVQRALLASNAYAGLVDGIDGERTKAAVLAYQKSNDLEPDGKITPALLEHMQYQLTLAEAARFTASTNKLPAVKAAANSETAERVLKAESALADLGYDPGEIDGIITSESEAAIRKFETDERLPLTGKLNPAVIAELAKTTGYEDLK
jgi:peptidoglycan hydrolase-like protein with peptidoglycan-binding domain